MERKKERDRTGREEKVLEGQESVWKRNEKKKGMKEWRSKKGKVGV